MKIDIAGRLEALPSVGVMSIFVYVALSALLVVSLIEAFMMLRDAYHNLHSIALIAAFIIALIPFVSIGFWSGKAIILVLDRFFPMLQQYATPHEERYPVHQVRSGYDSSIKPASRNRAAAPGAQWFKSGPRRQGEARAGVWMGAAFCVALSLAMTILAANWTNHGSINLALRLTGRLTLLLFWPAYVSSAVAATFGPRVGMLLRYGREFGLAYAAAQLVHFSLVAWLILSSRGSIAERVMPFFAVGVPWTYLLAASSVQRVQDVFGLKLCRILRTVGIEYIALVFLADFVFFPVPGRGFAHQIEYLPFAILIMVGPLLRAAAVGRRLQATVRSYFALRRFPLRR